MATREEINAALANVALISGDEALGKFGEAQLRTGSRSRKASIGKGFILDTQTGAISRDPNYAEYEKGRDVLESEQRARLQDDMLTRLGVSADLRSKQPRYTAQETEGGVAPVQINPNAAGGARAEPTIPVQRPLANSDAQTAAESERLAAEAQDLYDELSRVQGVVSSPKDIVASVIGKFPLVGSGAAQVAQENMFGGDQLSLKTRGARLESDLSNLAAGLSLTGFEIEQRNRWSPFAAGISQKESQRRLENIERNFASRGSAIRNANKPRNPNELSYNDWLKSENPEDDNAYRGSRERVKRVKVDAQGNPIGD